ncbi:hypothetical protein CN172_24870 [Sinorhizobium meliloti]|uniref:hypothetical protein n=1 Tax=Rhizobium meliloti TaxID=382 RepID=UPI000FD9F7C9|nr:hypothetical protein [Sinorhizobium meliloti]RVF00036.1 hypothetical protein CN232_15395 [Sinorhizobium meliloti]RVG94242.1 hypothetical protein CN221_16250 [Sinorhizobium meliloti]RVH38992.1 hypothetical protein CN208_28375 [Sinorhizobium meliloti]RVH67231.1 hypothetical protein CN209_08010 [Sinorhizobium meliloti]RVK08550.1 hypothetical protein CN172_24870 [Sinorhizobium meliloti]
MAFDAAAALERFADRETTVVLWRPGWGDRHTFENIGDAVLFAKADTSDPLKIELLVHSEGRDIPIEGENLEALAALVDAQAQ